MRSALRDAVQGVRDVERLGAKTAAGRANPREVRALGDSLARLPVVATALTKLTVVGELAEVSLDWDGADDIRAEIMRTLVERFLSGAYPRQ